MDFIQKAYFTSILINTPGEIREDDLAFAIEQSAADLALIILPKITSSKFEKARDLVGVCRIHQTVRTIDIEETMKNMSRRETRRRVNSINRGFSYDTTNENSAFYGFYDNMYIPTMQIRYGTAARTVSIGTAYNELFKKGHLFRIFLDDAWIAGSVCQIDESNKILNARLIGVQKGDETLKQQGAQNFVYHAILDWACAVPHIDTVDFQGCEPFLTKGTFQYKKRFGTRAIIPNNSFNEFNLIMRVKHLTPCVRHFLINNPSIVLTEFNQLAARYFYDSANPPRTDIPYECEGLEHKIIVSLDDWYE